MQIYRTEIYILIKTFANLKDKGNGNMVRNFICITDASKKNCIKTRQDIHTVSGHHNAMLEVKITAPVKPFQVKGDITSLNSLLDYLYSLLRYFRAYSIAWDDCDPVPFLRL